MAKKKTSAPKKRANGHRSRKGTNGQPCTTLHNDRNFDVTHAEHINPEDIKNNVYWLLNEDGKLEVVSDEERHQTFDEFEQQYYEDNFGHQLEQRNEKQEKSRHKERVMTMEQFRASIRYCPEEVIFTIGNRDNRVSPEVIQQAFEMFAEWHNRTFPNTAILDAALHLDEPDASPHIHSRQVWFTEVDGHKEVSQEKALAEMGIERPHSDKPTSHKNNAKMTYTTMVRDKWIEIARSFGIDVEDKPKPKKESGKPLDKLKAETIPEPPQPIKPTSEQPLSEETEQEYVQRLIAKDVSRYGLTSLQTKKTLELRKQHHKDYQEWQAYWREIERYKDWCESVQVQKAYQQAEQELEKKRAVVNAQMRAVDRGEATRYSKAEMEYKKRISLLEEKIKEMEESREQDIEEATEPLKEMIERLNRDKECVKKFLERNGLDIEDVINNEKQKKEPKKRRKATGYPDFD